MEAMDRSITPGDTLFVAHPRRLLHETSRASDGGKIVSIYYNDLELTFDDPELLSFGENLLVNSRFTAGDTMGWADDDAYPWETVKELLETLVSQGFLEIHDPASSCPEKPRPEVGGCPVPHGVSDPEPLLKARTWTPDRCLSLSHEIFGIAVETGNLESLIRGGRIAHSAVDVAGRQLGDENVYPPELQLTIPTEHRGCGYRGSRYQHDLPMNVSGLKLVQGCWSEVLQTMRFAKREYLRRRQTAGANPPALSLLEVYLYATTLLSLPAYLMHRSDNRVTNGSIPQPVSALFRAIDGTRMTSRHMMLTGDAPLAHDVIPTPEGFLFYAEKERLLLTAKGVCAGPPTMINEFLTEVMNVAPAEEAAPSGLSDFPVALDYGLAACELEAVVDQFWLEQARIIEDLLSRLHGAEGERDAVTETLRVRLAKSMALEAMPFSIGHLYVQPGAREMALEMFGAVIETCQRMRGLHAGSAGVARRSEAGEATRNEERRSQIRRLLIQELPALPVETSANVAIAWTRLLDLEERALPAMALRQAEVNRILDRAPPSRTFTASDLASAWPAASLRSALTEALQVEIVTRDRQLTLSRLAARAEPLASVRPTALASPVLLDASGFRTLRGLFARSRYSLESALWRLWGRSFDTELAAAIALQRLGSQAPSFDITSPLDVLLRLFLIPGAVEREVFRRVLRSEEEAALVASGLVGIRDDHVTSAFAVGSIDGIYFLTDTRETIRASRRAPDARVDPTSANELVMPAYVETYFFSGKTHRHPAERALDLCTGSGVHALLASRYAKQTIGSDVSARAIRFAEWNKQLNGIANVDFVTGSVWEPVHGRKFERITVNPPYQPDSIERPGRNWWGAGPRGDGIASLIVGGLHDHLAVDGELQMVGQTSSWEDEDFRRQVDRHLGSSAGMFDVRLDTEDTPLADYRKQHPDEPLAGLVSTAYGVVTITRLSSTHER